MFMLRSKKSQPLWGTALIALLACAFCLFNIYLHSPEAMESASQFCPTNGCALYHDFTVFGISLWFVGAVSFLLIFFFCLKGSRSIVLFLSAAGLILDSALLALLLFTSPCVSCLGVALAFGLIYLSARYNADQRQPASFKPGWLFVLWAVLFFSNIFSALEESFGSWVIAGPENAGIKLYFSPSCPACVEALYGLADNPEAAFLPVAKNESDKETILRLNHELRAGGSFADAFNRAQNSILPANTGPFERALLSFKLYRNRAESMRLGNKTLPLLIVTNIPTLLAHPGTQQQRNGAAGRSGVGLPEARYTDEPMPMGNMTPRQAAGDSQNRPQDNQGEAAQAHRQAPGVSPLRAGGNATTANPTFAPDDLQNLFSEPGIGNCPDNSAAPCPPDSLPPRR